METQTLIQEPSVHSLNQSSPIEYLFQSTHGFILAHGLKSALEIMDFDYIGLNGVLYFTHQNSPKIGAKTLNIKLIIAKIMERIVESGVKDTGSTQMLNFNNQLLIASFAILETRRDLEPKFVPQLFLGGGGGGFTGDTPVSFN